MNQYNFRCPTCKRMLFEADHSSIGTPSQADFFHWCPVENALSFFTMEYLQVKLKEAS